MALVPGLLLACAGERGTSSEDSDAPEVAGAPLEIEESARVTLGRVPDDTLHIFHRVEPPFLLPDGRVGVPLRSTGTIRVFGPDGAFVTSHGHRGKAPGEFEGLSAAWARGDTVEALDRTSRRITRFLPDGTTETAALDTQLWDLSFGGALGDGWAVAGVVDGGIGRRDRIVVRRIGRDGTDLGVITGVDGMARYGEPRVFSGPTPLSPMPFVWITGDRVYVGESLTPRVEVFDASGALRGEIGWESAGNDADIREVVRAVVDSALEMAAPDQRATVRRRLELAPEPEALPLFSRVIVDEEGFIWIRPYEPLEHAFPLGRRRFVGGRAAPGGRWRILTPEGVEVGSIAVPPDLDLEYVGSDAVVGIAVDEFGVESVRVHALRRR
ncbi:MAG: hypothetical protein RQ745_01450 [Longimicrobiales bacterium]|nr:hypothetical protein [Longimicrobiales bacterium]